MDSSRGLHEYTIGVTQSRCYYPHLILVVDRSIGTVPLVGRNGTMVTPVDFNLLYTSGSDNLFLRLKVDRMRFLLCVPFLSKSSVSKDVEATTYSNVKYR
jgi:hypothetical protein